MTTRNKLFAFLLTCLLAAVIPVQAQNGNPDSAGEADADRWIIPLLARSVTGDGPGFESFLTLLNSSDTSLEAAIRIHRSNGEPGPIFFCADDLSRPEPDRALVELPAHAVTQCRAFKGAFRGWASVKSLGDLGVYGEVQLQGAADDAPFVGQRHSGEILTAGVIRAVRPGRVFQSAAVFFSPARKSAFSIVNPSPINEVTVEIDLVHRLGSEIFGPAKDAPIERIHLTLQPLESRSLFIDEIFDSCSLDRGPCFPGVPMPASPFFGSVTFTSEDHPIAVGGFDVLFPDVGLVELPVFRLR